MVDHTSRATTRRNEPLFVALEGIKGSGKSMQIEGLSSYARSLGLRVGVFRYTQVRRDLCGRLVRSAFKSGDAEWWRRMLARCRLLQELLYTWQARLNLRDLGQMRDYDLIVGDRCAVTAFVVHRSLAKGTLGRLILSTLERKFVPHFVVYLRLDPVTALTRISSRSSRSVDEDQVALVNMAQRYESLAMGRNVPKVLCPAIWVSVDAKDAPAAVQNQLHHTLQSILISEGLLADEPVPILADSRN